MDVPSTLLADGLSALRTLPGLLLPELKQLPLTPEVPFHDPAEPFLEVLVPGGIKRVGDTADFAVTPDRGIAGVGQVNPLRLASFLTDVLKIQSRDPSRIK